MAEALVLVCDRCGKPVADSVTLRVGNRNYVTDLCREHLDDLVRHARVPKRGRKPKSLSAGSASRTRSTKKSPAKRTRAKSKAKSRRRAS